MLFKLTNPKNSRLTHCGVLEFVPTDEPLCYLPHWMMKHLLIEEGDELLVQSIHSLPNATYVRFQPQSKIFLDITNPKAVLEKVLRNFSCLTKGDVISINYLNRNYELAILELKPANVVSIIECDLEVDFAPPIDYIEPKSLEKDQQITKNPTTFMPFNGHGNRLNGRIKSNDKQEEKNMIPQIRGMPNYDYKYGLLQFSRIPLNSLNNDMNEILDKNHSSNTFQPFTGEGKILRQPRNQRPK
jgi:ubiquitin fusion degradation protein 1